jgi:hypothetical protein
MRLRRVIGGLVFVVLFAGGVVAASADTDNGVTATFSPSSPNGNNSFYTSPVDITYEGDLGDTCNPASETYSGPDDANASVSSTCTPLDPTASPRTGTFAFKYDETAPNVSVTFGRPPDSNGWYNHPVLWDVSGSDGASGIDGCNPAGGTYGGPNDASVAVRGECTNRAGLSASDQATLKYDETAPTVTVTLGRPPDLNGWYNSPVTYSAEMQDAMSGPGSCDPSRTYNGPDDPSVTVTLSCTDAAGNSASGTATFSYDETRPVLTLPTLLPQEAVGPNGAPISYTVTATDPAKGSQPPSDLIPGRISCAPQSGSVFAIATTPVQCTATDDAGNQGSGSFDVTVADRTPPTFVINPQNITVQAQNVNTGTPATNNCIQDFLNGPTANDVVDGSRPVTNDNTRTRFPVGSTTVTFTATDTRNNSITAPATVTVKRGPQECTFDSQAPWNPTRVRVNEGNNLVVLTWRNPRAADFSHIEVYRQLASRSDLGVRVCQTRRQRCVDRGVRNGILYRYTLFAFDEAGNNSRGLSRFAKPHRILLLRPRDGARISRPPVFDWVSIRGADYYNVQLYRVYRGRQVKILSRWPKASKYDLPWRWIQDRRVRRFVPGRYYWYVWPGFGSLRAGNYGKVMGPNDFTVVRRR